MTVTVSAKQSRIFPQPAADHADCQEQVCFLSLFNMPKAPRSLYPPNFYSYYYKTIFHRVIFSLLLLFFHLFERAHFMAFCLRAITVCFIETIVRMCKCLGFPSTSQFPLGFSRLVTVRKKKKNKGEEDENAEILINNIKMQSCVIRFAGHVAVLNVEYLCSEPPIVVLSGQQERESFCSLLHPACLTSLWFHLFFRCLWITEFAQCWPLAIAGILWVRKSRSGRLYPQKTWLLINTFTVTLAEESYAPLE